MKVLLANDAAYDHGLVENVAPLLVKLAPGYSQHLLAPATGLRIRASPPERKPRPRDRSFLHPLPARGW
jgi:hypothetical protein